MIVSFWMVKVPSVSDPRFSSFLAFLLDLLLIPEIEFDFIEFTADE